MSDMLYIVLDLDTMQAWASLTGGQARGLAVHGLTLASRSEGSRHDFIECIVCVIVSNVCIVSKCMIIFSRRKAVILIKKTIRSALAADGEGVPDENSVTEPSSACVLSI